MGIKALDIDELNIKNREITLLLNRLTQLTLSDSDSDYAAHDDDEEEEQSSEFDIASESQSDNETNAVDGMQTMNESMEYDTANDVNMEGQECVADKSKMKKKKSIVHKVSKFMLSILMVGAPLFYFYVH